MIFSPIPTSARSALPAKVRRWAASETQPAALSVLRPKSAAILDTGEHLAKLEQPLSDRS